MNEKDHNKLDELKSQLTPNVKQQLDECAAGFRSMIEIYGLVGLAALLEVAEEYKTIIRAGEGVKIEID